MKRLTILLLLLCTLGWAQEPPAQILMGPPPPTTCTSYPSGDGCNTCTSCGGLESCTLVYCMSKDELDALPGSGEPKHEDDGLTEYRELLAEQLAPMRAVMAEQLKVMQQQRDEIKALREQVGKMKGCK